MTVAGYNYLPGRVSVHILLSVYPPDGCENHTSSLPDSGISLHGTIDNTNLAHKFPTNVKIYIPSCKSYSFMCLKCPYRLELLSHFFSNSPVCLLFPKLLLDILLQEVSLDQYLSLSFYSDLSFQRNDASIPIQLRISPISVHFSPHVGCKFSLSKES